MYLHFRLASVLYGMNQKLQSPRPVSPSPAIPEPVKQRLSLSDHKENIEHIKSSPPREFDIAEKLSTLQV